MKTKMQSFEVMVPNLEGTAIAELVKIQIPVQFSEEIGEWVLTPEAHEIIDATKVRHMGLLLPAQFKELRRRLGFSQKEMGELFQAGEKSWTRWESGSQRPSRSISLLIRALYDGELSVDYLLKQAGKPQSRAIENDAEDVASPWVKVLSAPPKEQYEAAVCLGRRDTSEAVVQGIQAAVKCQSIHLVGFGLHLKQSRLCSLTTLNLSGETLEQLTEAS
ncbi:type II toxin-antitoxin system MqsA family antitoxin [Prosthecobacter sp.]|uniref:type II toxin-antitoxin system MqsA family antitoxin n=1 Tax=Prosthecobacter sp. TaxID=1965333 RepID=UPI0037841036